MNEQARPRKQEQERAQRVIDEVAPGVLRLQLPVDLPGLGHVNCYALEDERGVALVDPGLPGPEAWATLVERLDDAGLRVRDVHTVVVTHSHFDHFGGADRLREESGAQVLAHESFQSIWDADDANEFDDSEGPIDDDEFYRRVEETFKRKTPWGTTRTPPPKEEIERFGSAGRVAARWFRTPRPSITVADSDVVKLARREWIALHTPGHTQDHLCLYDPEHGVLLSGDHVLPTITPHISGVSQEPDPLASYFGSLRRMQDLDAIHVVLPAHGHPFADLHGRTEHIIEHHEERLDVLRKAAEELGEASVPDYMRVLFSERAWGNMAESETFAHLEHLRLTGEAVAGDREGVTTFELKQ